MWTRKELKNRAKDVLRKSYWKAFVVSLVLVFIGGNLGSRSGGASSFSGSRDGIQNFGGDIGYSALPVIIFIMIIVGLFALTIAMGIRIFLGYPLEVGGKKYFVKSAQDDINMNNLGFAFEKGIYFDVIKSMLWKGILNFLWYLLLLIPGIIKAYSYSMVPYILGDNPNIGYKRALDLSKKMTRGHKFDMFVLDLSFLGWYILGLIALGIGVLFVMPYVYATKGELYIVLRKYTLANNLSTHEELRLKKPLD
ncbi:DUF975 family protein [Clostridium sp. D2Q-11]|uniref:DUF975 family protein n=1 Tax=Anaeromonas frigoriresistens TaxID=2683708 RepID=A0A942UVT9_9FIRM|nr:DUF975 family protein [Anaeromonas frigoriresistens]MBS4537739.1 DUF975 family protein [Anaeromonas frigoriresistens]